MTRLPAGADPELCCTYEPPCAADVDLGLKLEGCRPDFIRLMYEADARRECLKQLEQVYWKGGGNGKG